MHWNTEDPIRGRNGDGAVLLKRERDQKRRENSEILQGKGTTLTKKARE